ncbi:ABC transporter permease [uncultured Exiguobacterium sp.]|uniref:ABC transporter permease n=1 Tax=uncultured Exiguobacterium sp. TaxID=202669 RepID=UPI0025D0126A|nr:ABC transporter permease [uncultured Exiguobacterium sp.]
MLRFIWNSWWRNKERFILLLVGVLIVSTGLSYLIGTTQANNGTVVDELQKRWGSSYDIVVRPEGSRSVTEDLNLLEPNYMSGLDGGISRKQYETIKQIADVEVAAPIAMIGNYYTDAVKDTYNFKEPGIYKISYKDMQDTGLKKETESMSFFAGAGWSPPESDGLNRDISPQELGEFPIYGYGSAVMLAGIDPEAEAQLVGLDQATKNATHSRYFTKDDVVNDYGDGVWNIPLIMNSQEYVNASRTYRYEKVDIPLVKDSMVETVRSIMKKGGESYLKTLPLKDTKEYYISTEQASKQLIKNILEDKVPENANGGFDWMYLKPSSVEYQTIASPFAKRWPFTYQVTPQEVAKEVLISKRSMYRKARIFGDGTGNLDKVPKMHLNYIGVFDPKKLNISKDPLTELPMETYFPAKAQWVMDKNEKPVNPVREVKPTNDPYDFLTKPPSMLTTLDAAFKLRGDKAISAIRVNVKGVETMNATSEKKLKAVAQEIEDKTGLITDVTLGSSPQLALTYLPGLKGESALGWIQQPWIKLGSSMAIFHEAKVGMSGIIASVIAVALVYVFSSNIILLYARKKEFAILLSLGWRPRQLSKLLFLEATLLGTLVALISWTILGSFWLTADHPIALSRIILIGLAGLLIYWGGTLVPMTLIRRIQPFESMRSGEVSKGRRFVRAQSVLGMSINQLATYWQRTILSTIAIALPTSLFIFFLFITFRLKGVLYATWLGEYVALEVGTMHYVAMGVALLIAILTTTEIMWQNVNERKSQLAVLKATGWRNGQIRTLVLSEGLMTGLFAGIIGLLIALAMIGFVYNQFPTGELGFLSVMLLLPAITGVLGALLPAQRAVSITPNAAIGSVATNTKATERRFRLALSAVGGALVVGVASLFFFATTEEGPTSTKPVQTAAPTVKTTGTKLADVKDKKKKASSMKKVNSSKLDKLMKRGVIQTYPGDPKAKRNIFRVDKLLLSPPKELKLPTLDDEQYVTVPVILENYKDSNVEGGPAIYRPSTFTLEDTNGKVYEAVDYENRNPDVWKDGYRYFAPSVSRVDLVFRVPRDKNTYVLFATSEAIAKPTTVKIEVNAVDDTSTTAKSGEKKQSKKTNTGVIKKLMDKGGKQTYPGDPNVMKYHGFKVSSAKRVQLPDLPSSKQAVSVTLELQVKGEATADSYIDYKPFTFPLIDSHKKSYTSEKTINHNKKAYSENLGYHAPLHSKIDVIYIVPKTENTFVMNAYGGFTGYLYTVKIKL